MAALAALRNSIWAAAPSWVLEFSWEPGVTPASSLEFVGAAIVLYVVLMRVLNLVPISKPVAAFLLLFQAAYNFFLFVMSVFLFGLLVLEALHLWLNEAASFWGLFCGPLLGRLETCIWFFHVSKYVELVESMLLSLRKRHVPFLHAYHHVITLMATYYGLSQRITLQWVGATFNTLVHIPMYLYFTLHVLDLHPPQFIKRLITHLQLTQFRANLIGLALSGIYSYIHLGTELECRGGWISWSFTFFANATFLYMFSDMFRRNYEKGKSLVRTEKGQEPEKEKAKAH